MLQKVTCSFHKDSESWLKPYILLDYIVNHAVLVPRCLLYSICRVKPPVRGNTWGQKNCPCNKIDWLKWHPLLEGQKCSIIVAATMANTKFLLRGGGKRGGVLPIAPDIILLARLTGYGWDMTLESPHQRWSREEVIVFSKKFNWWPTWNWWKISHQALWQQHGFFPRQKSQKIPETIFKYVQENELSLI